MNTTTNSYKQYKYEPFTHGCYSGWRRYEGNPVISAIGHCYDVSVIKVAGKFRMYFSWAGGSRSIAYLESDDGFEWSREPKVALESLPDSKWEKDVNRICVIHHDGVYKMWYSGQSYTAQTLSTLEDGLGGSFIGYAESSDGSTFKRLDEPVLKPEAQWEYKSLMCPHVNWDEEEQIFKMWYSGGQWIEPNAIGYATSKDGIDWSKHKDNPIFEPIPENRWERERTTACQVIKMDCWYYMFYIGFEDVHSARICFARSKDGITGWQRHKDNPVISGSNMGWDADGAYKPFLYYEEEKDRWILWYNGRSGWLEHIGIATHEGKDLGF